MNWSHLLKMFLLSDQPNTHSNISRKEWKQHFLSVSEIIGIYEGEYWDVVCFGDHWKIIGKQVAYEFHSVPNNDKVEYTNLDILLSDLLLLDMPTRILLKPKNYWIPE